MTFPSTRRPFDWQAEAIFRRHPKDELLERVAHLPTPPEARKRLERIVAERFDEDARLIAA